MAAPLPVSQPGLAYVLVLVLVCCSFPQIVQLALQCAREMIDVIDAVGVPHQQRHDQDSPDDDGHQSP
jgi:hypothetical protein